MKWNKSPLTIVSILSGGGGEYRRGRWRKAALVSLLYPYFIEPETLQSSDSLYQAELIRVPIINLDVSEVLTASDQLFEAVLKDSKINIEIAETLLGESDLFEASLRSVLIPISINETLSASNSLHQARLPQVGIYITTPETLLSNSILFEAVLV